jgi:microcin C transport system substrate-binding protein
MRHWMICSALIVSSQVATPALAAHGYALWGQPKYAADFKHFDYVNPQAPKGGELRMVSNLRYSTFDKYNPFTIKARRLPIWRTCCSRLLTSLDETAYGLWPAGRDVEVAADGLSATFKLRKQARFHNGKPVLAQDVKHSYETLLSKYVSPGYKTLFAEVAGCDVIDERTVRFRFESPTVTCPDRGHPAAGVQPRLGAGRGWQAQGL